VYLFISPHLDDIALSCGGYVRRLTHSGERVVIATVCTADAPPGQPLSPAAQHEHWQWQLGGQPYRLRCLEDERMAQQLGAEYMHLGLLDAIYRHDAGGRPLYEGKQFMGGEVHAWDWQQQYPALLDVLGPLLHVLTPKRVFCPLTAGGHVDHILTRRAMEQLCAPSEIAYYEDYPYAQKDAGALARLLDDGAANAASAAGVWQPILIELTPEETDARVAAINCYQSQLFAVFGDAASMPQRVREYIARTGGERYWERV
jgi:LmbE family N-acetylglucosaminyl deacetylase